MSHGWSIPQPSVICATPPTVPQASKRSMITMYPTVQVLVPLSAVIRIRNTCRQHSRHLCGCGASHSVGAELGRPPMCCMVNGLHSIERCARWRHNPFHPTGLFWDLFQRPKRAQNLPRSVKAPFGTLLLTFFSVFMPSALILEPFSI